MPRILSDDLNTMVMQDNLSGEDLTVFYRMPTTKERSGYANESIKRQRNKVSVRISETRRKYGKLILQGIKEGDFMVKKDGKLVPLSSDEGSPNFDPGWKDKMEVFASDIIEALAATVFDASVRPVFDSEGTEDGEEEEPEKN